MNEVAFFLERCIGYCLKLVLFSLVVSCLITNALCSLGLLGPSIFIRLVLGGTALQTHAISLVASHFSLDRYTKVYMSVGRLPVCPSSVAFVHLA